jgi:hypothetical protein
MDIDISELNSKEIISVLQNYPKGALKVLNGRVYWSSVYIEPVFQQQQEMNTGRHFPGVPANRPQEKLPFNFEKAADALGSMIG